jgi:hypothetical protein
VSAGKSCWNLQRSQLLEMRFKGHFMCRCICSHVVADSRKRQYSALYLSFVVPEFDVAVKGFEGNRQMQLGVDL